MSCTPNRGRLKGVRSTSRPSGYLARVLVSALVVLATHMVLQIKLVCKGNKVTAMWARKVRRMVVLQVGDVRWRRV
jgi:hypothetical protein